MKHLAEEQLMLLYYGEPGLDGAREHLAGCEQCHAAYEALEAALGGIELPVPERDEHYGEQVWLRLRPQLNTRPSRLAFWRELFAPRPWAMVAAMAVLVVAAFLAGRFLPARPDARPIARQTRERVLLVAVGDHLERSQMILLELVNTKPQDKTVDISEEQERARQLVESNRLYRQTAARSGDPGIAAVLDDLERVLLEVAHSPAELSAEQFENLRRRVEAQGILFKVRVVDSHLRSETRKRL